MVILFYKILAFEKESKRFSNYVDDDKNHGNHLSFKVSIHIIKNEEKKIEKQYYSDLYYILNSRG